MTRSTQRTATHSIRIPAPPDTVYDVIAQAARWPQHLAPTVHVEYLESSPRHERLHIWAHANGEVKDWISRRTLNPVERTVEFEQEVSRPPVASMGGRWTVRQDGTGTELVLDHHYTAVDDSTENIAWIESALEENSTRELAGIERVARSAERIEAVILDFEDEVYIDGAVEDVYDFLYQAAQWPHRLPHVARLELDEPSPGVQSMTMDTRAADGTVHQTASVRVCFAPDRIVYKQTVVPALMAAHTGCWTLLPTGSGMRAASRHVVTIAEGAVATVLGADRTTEDARAFLHNALSINSRTTLDLARRYAESRRSEREPGHHRRFAADDPEP